MQRQKAHFGAIDGMRGIAAVCVVIFHYAHFYIPEAGIPKPETGIPYAAILQKIYTHGEDFVRLFWVISGFVFAHVYWTRETTAREFMVARFARLYPLHFVTLILVAVLQTISATATGHFQIIEDNDLRHFIAQLFLMGSSLNFTHPNSFNAAIWSVSAEVFVYIAFFFTLRWTRNNQLTGGLLLASISYITAILKPDNFLVTDWVFVCGVFFFAGTVCYALYTVFSHKRAIFYAILAVFFGFSLASILMGNVDLTLISLWCTLVLVLATLQGLPFTYGRILRFLGNISYSLYLVHMPIQIFVLLIADLVFDGTRAFADSYVTLPLFLITSITVAYYVHIKFEKPTGAWIRRRLAKSTLDQPSVA